MASKATKESEFHTSGVSKVDAYKWGIQDKPGEFRMIDKNILLVDDQYQRECKSTKTKAIASNWSWFACGVLIVAFREDNFFVVDGQHRYRAAMKRIDIRELPCLVFQSEGLVAEASAFLTIQTQRKPVDAHEKFHALLTIQDKKALMVQSMCKSAGRQIARGSNSPTTISCISLLLRQAENNPGTLINLWPLLVAASEGQPMKESVIDGLIYIENQLSKNGQSLIGSNWSDRIVALGSDTLHRSAIGFAQAFRRGGARVWAFGMKEAINKGLRNRLEYSGSESAN